MKRIVAALAALALSTACLAGGDHTKPKPQPAPQPAPAKAHDSNDLGPILLLSAAIIGVVIYHQKSEKDEKKVTIAPTPDGKGATASLEYRF